MIVTPASRPTCSAAGGGHSKAPQTNTIGEVGVAQTAITSSIGTLFKINSPCFAGGQGCPAASVPAGTLLFACLWTFNRGYRINPDRCPVGAETDAPVTITAPAGWRPLDHFGQYDPYGAHDNKSPGGFDEFRAFYRVAESNEPNSYIFKLSQCAEDQAAALVAYAGVDGAVPFDPGNGQGGHRFAYGNRGNPVTIEELINQTAGDLLSACVIDGYDQGRFSRPFGYRPRWSASSPYCCTVQGFDQSRSNSGGTGGFFSLIQPSPETSDDDPPIDNWFGELVSLQPKNAREACASH